MDPGRTELVNPLINHMGPAFQRLSPLLQRAHTGKIKLSGASKIVRGNWLAQIICTVFRFPKAGEAVDLTVMCEHNDKSMSWKRDFNGLQMHSTFKQQGDYLVESLGPLALSFMVKEDNGGLQYIYCKTKFLRIPIPGFLSPQVNAAESEKDGQYRFYVDVSMFLVGPVISYSGTLNLEVIE